MNLRFVEETHQYYLGKLELPSVTRILGAVGLIDTRWFKPEHAARGKAIHAVLQYVDKGILDWGTVDPAIYGWIEAYMLFLEEHKPVYTGIEKKTYHQDRLYAGIIDRLTATGLDDIKTGAEAPWHQLQLTAYEDAEKSQDGISRECCALYLRENGTYKYEPVEKDLNAWNAVLHLFTWRNLNGCSAT